MSNRARRPRWRKIHGGLQVYETPEGIELGRIHCPRGGLAWTCEVNGHEIGWSFFKYFARSIVEGAV